MNLPPSIEIALGHHRAGRLAQAEPIYRDILAQQPGRDDALHLLGVLLHQKNNDPAAIELIGKAIAINPTSAEYHSNLGAVLGDHQRFEEAIVSYKKALAIDPKNAKAFNNLGNALIHLNRFEEAVNACSRAIELEPRSAISHYNLGNALLKLGKTEEAVFEYRRSLSDNPDFLLSGHNLALALGKIERWDEAASWCREALKRNPRDPQIHNDLAIALAGIGHFDEAIAACERCLKLQPSFAGAYLTYGKILMDTNHCAEAIAAYRRALTQRPDWLEVHNNLAVAYTQSDRFDDALASIEQALTLQPNLAETHSNKGAVLKEMGRIDEAINAYRQALAIEPKQLRARHNLILAVHYHPAYDGNALLKESTVWNSIHAEPLRSGLQPHSNILDPTRPLRIGYVSPDFRGHVAGYSLLPFFRRHHQDQVSIFCYSNVRCPDALTQEFQASASVWRNIYELSDERAAELIRSDAIDILVDLALHSAGNRLLLFARKPAPIQVTYLAYCGTSGMPTMDYRLSDPYIDPPGTDLSCYSEQTVRLPETYWCYKPRGEAPQVSEPPVFANGYVTFGSMNNFAKNSEPCLDLWCEIMCRVADSRLIIQSPEGSPRESLLKRFSQAGIGPDRVHFVGRQPWMQFMRSFEQIDIALDPFPYSGGITTCDTLWMGVPVISMPGKTAVGRGGQSILNNIGLPELVPSNPEEYIRIAVDLAADTTRLGVLRRSLRDRMQRSPLINAERFATAVENIYQQMWKTWCSSHT